MRTQLRPVCAAGLLLFIACHSAGPAPAPATHPSPQSGASAEPPPSPYPTPAAPAPETAPVAPIAAEPAPAAPPAPIASAVPPQPQTASPPTRPWEDILRLKQAGLSDEFLLNKIRTDDVNYQLTTSDILQLRAAGISETILAAMMQSGRPAVAAAGTPVARHAEFNGLARVGKGFLMFGTSTKNAGRLVIDGETVTWYDADPKKNFSVYVKNVKEIFNTCVLRPGQNLCLEFGLVTYTGEEYRFRDPGWKNGDNRLVTEATSYFRQAFPNLFFSQRAVSEL